MPPRTVKPLTCPVTAGKPPLTSDNTRPGTQTGTDPAPTRRRRRKDDAIPAQYEISHPRVDQTPADMLRRLLDDHVDALDVRRHHVPRPVAVDVDCRVLRVVVDLKEVARPVLWEGALHDLKIDSSADEKKPAPPGRVPVTGPAKQAANEPGRCLDNNGVFVENAERHHNAA